MPLLAFLGLGLPELIVIAIIGVLIFAVPAVLVLVLLLQHKGGEPLNLDDEPDERGDGRRG
jgi:hypothetical protein